MRKLLCRIVAAVVLITFAPSVLAEPKPTSIPHMVKPGEQGWLPSWTAIDTMWADMSGAAELPAGVMNSDGDDYIRGPVDMGFTFHFMNGPVEPAPGWPPGDLAFATFNGEAPPLPEDWPINLTDKGYDKVWVADNGYLVMADPQYLAQVRPLDFVLQDPNIGTTEHYDDMALGPQRPNNYVAPFWSDWIIGDNTTWKVTKLKKMQVECDDAVGYQRTCNEWVPSEWAEVERPRGRLLVKTFGEAPNRVFVVEWQNARNYDSGNLVSFQAQLFEGSNAILFQYKDPLPEEDGRPFFQPGGVIGIEDSFGQTYVGQSFSAGVLNKPGLNWTPAPAPVSDGDQIGFVY
jgi:hypothetical protein